MTRKERLYLITIWAVVGFSALGTLAYVDWLIALCVFLLLWANNVVQNLWPGDFRGTPKSLNRNKGVV